jgi:histone H3/H4
MAEVLVVTSKVKALVKAKDLRTSADFIDALSKKVEALVEAAVPKAVSAGRKTVQAEDLL